MKFEIINNSELTLYDTNTIAGYQEFKAAVIALLRDGEVSSLTVNMPTMVALPSSLIGFFLKLVYQDNIMLKVRAGDDRLLKLIHEFQLSEAFNAEKM